MYRFSLSRDVFGRRCCCIFQDIFDVLCFSLFLRNFLIRVRGKVRFRGDIELRDGLGNGFREINHHIFLRFFHPKKGTKRQQSKNRRDSREAGEAAGG